MPSAAEKLCQSARHDLRLSNVEDGLRGFQDSSQNVAEVVEGFGRALAQLAFLSAFRVRIKNIFPNPYAIPVEKPGWNHRMNGNLHRRRLGCLRRLEPGCHSNNTLA